ncbi:hypothetical protein FJ987_19920 [Mesorhizobium sp. CU2]|uniref:hypothetical protein n=1 Tax=unclassified Mesorhizobium TaxID=325217 RepID=UPI0011286234|nr:MULTISPECIES: hypothetical protein [unclassified Mesorhizobium]TPN88357.1 hypothetical protein FJ988_04735 [Mesorhizobium sp. CU3]TPO10898.1 hypothetical protein FJ987_19920 [Mesorhizobium sp. CU2]
MEDSSDANQERWEREDTWQSLAIATAVILLTGFLAASIWVIVAPDDADRLMRVQISAPFGVFGGAVVSFCTIVWRGRISKRQADAQLKATNLQREQIDKLALQIAATEENNLADLLQRGAELIGESGKKSHVAAGIAILQSVAEAPNAKFAARAMDLLADYVQDGYEYGEPNNLVAAAMSALSQGSRLDRFANRRLTFDARALHSSRIDEGWVIIIGAIAVRYIGGKFDHFDETALSESKTRFSFSETAFEDCTIDLAKFGYSKCNFVQCEITSCSASNIKRNDFDTCDFSGSKVLNTNSFPDLRPNGNYYFSESPPIARRKFEWSRVLNVVSDDNSDPQEVEASSS